MSQPPAVGPRAAYGGDQVAGSKHVYNFNGGFGQPFPTGFHPYSASVLAAFGPFVPPVGLDRLAALLHGGPVAILRGRAGMGKQAAALGMLAELGAQRIYGVDPEVKFPLFDPGSVDPVSGLILDGLSAAAAARLRRYDLDRIGQVLARRDSWLVITLDESVALADPELVELTAELSAPPPSREIVEAHLQAGLGPLRAERARMLLAHPLVSEQLDALAPGLPCRDAAALGRLLADHAGDPDTAAERFRLLAEARGGRELEDWFANLPDQATKFFAIALAVGEGMSVEWIAGMADTIERRYREDFGTGSGEAGLGPNGRDPLGARRTVRLRDVRAVSGTRMVQTKAGQVPVESAVFVDRDYARNLLEHIWAEYSRIRPILLEWITSVGADASRMEWRRAALAAGTLARNPDSFEEIRTAAIDPWALAGDCGCNESAAIALRTAGERSELAGMVRHSVREWAGAADPSLRATAAWALGLLAGGIEFVEAATLLTALAADEHDSVVEAVGHALTAMVNGASESAEDRIGGGEEAVAAEVFGLVGKWTGHRDGRVKQTAQSTILVMAAELERSCDPWATARTQTRTQTQTRHSTVHGGEAPWPGLLWFAERGPDLGRQVAGLWAAALTSAEFGRAARAELDRWARRVEPCRDRREALGRLLFTAAERDRVRRILAHRAAAWTKPPDPAAPAAGALVISLLNIS